MDIELFDKRYVYLEWSDELEGKDCILAQTYQNLKDFVNSGDEGRIFKVDKGTEKPFTNHWKDCDFCYFDPNLVVKKAWIEGKTIQKECGLKWKDYIEVPRTSPFFYNIKWDAYEWRVKPTTEEIINYTNETSREPIYILNMHKKDRNEFEFSISDHNSFSPIYANTRKKCQHVINTVATKFTDKCVGCNGNYCFNCKPLQDFIKNIEFTRRMTNRELSEYLAKGNGECKNVEYLNTSTSHWYQNGAENKNVDDNIFIRDFGSDEWREPLIEV
jgi:hypothetical protein